MKSARSLPATPSWGRAAAAAALLCPLLGAGCDAAYPTTPREPRALVVHGMLAAGEPGQEIVVEYTRGLEEGYFLGLTPAAGAEVVVASGDERHHFIEEPGRPGVYRAAFVPRAGFTYQLQVRGPSGEAATGETQVPAAPHLLAPRADTVVPWGDYVTFRWGAPTAAAAYVLVSGSPGQVSGLATLRGPVPIAGSTATVQPGTFAGIAVPYRVAAVDANYVHYAGGLAGQRSDGGRLRGTVTGGYGLFGSYAMSATRIISIR